MSVFSEKEREYLLSGVRLGRLATVGSDGTPHVVPTGFRYNTDHDTIDVGGHDFAKRKKYRDVLKNPKVAFVVDDVASVNPWRVRGIEIRGEAEVLDTGGTELMPGFDPEMFRITPKRIVSWGLEQQMSYNWRSVPLTRPYASMAGDEMSFDTHAGTRRGWQPGTGGAVGRWLTKRAVNQIRRSGKMMGLGFDALVLTTIGRKTGAERTTPVGRFPGEGSSWLSVASAAGVPRNPA